MSQMTKAQSEAIAHEIAALADDFAKTRSKEESGATNAALVLLIEALLANGALTPAQLGAICNMLNDGAAAAPRSEYGRGGETLARLAERIRGTV
ncbi:hypothetical protein [Limimaricola hongkongensis]|uniref:hypothetical protein n=1 Tax=Limimaricola hongkongensis TaxID=278132 RepID=UPI0013A54ED1|nr:hypothetical protein [Limimaricola hongkongensis]